MPLNGFSCEVTTATMQSEGELPNLQNLRLRDIEWRNLTRLTPLAVQPPPSTFEVVATTFTPERIGGYSARDRDNCSDNCYKYLDTVERLVRVTTRVSGQTQEAKDYRMMLNTLYYHLTVCDLRVLIHDNKLMEYLDDE